MAPRKATDHERSKVAGAHSLRREQTVALKPDGSARPPQVVLVGSARRARREVVFESLARGRVDFSVEARRQLDARIGLFLSTYFRANQPAK